MEAVEGLVFSLRRPLIKNLLPITGVVKLLALGKLSRNAHGAIDNRLNCRSNWLRGMIVANGGGGGWSFAIPEGVSLSGSSLVP